MEDKIVGRYDDGKYVVSTVQLTVEHPWGNEWGGYWYETMIFPIADGKIQFNELYTNRYKTREEAEKGHKKAIELLYEILSDGKKQ